MTDLALVNDKSVGMLGMTQKHGPHDDNGAPEKHFREVGQRIGLAASYIGMPQVSALTGKSERQIKRYISGSEPPFGVLYVLVKASGVSFDWLASGHPRTPIDFSLDVKLREMRLKDLSRDLSASTSGDDRSDIRAMMDIERDLRDASQIMLDRQSERAQRQSPQNHHGAKGAASQIAPLNSQNKKKRTPAEKLPDSHKFDHVIDYNLAQILAAPEPSIRARDAGSTIITDLEQPSMVSIPRYDEVRPAAGFGSAVVSEAPTTRVAFELRWLIDIGVKPEASVILPAQGDSMEPTIMNGAPMLVDTSKTEVRNGFIYVFNIDGDLVVKRIERLPDGSCDLISDNVRYPPRNLSQNTVLNMTVVGRVYAAVSKF